MKARILLIGVIASQTICLAEEDKSDQNEKRTWGRSYSLHSLPDGKDTRLEVLSIDQDPDHLLGGFVLSRQRKETVRQLVIKGHLKKGEDFTPNVSLEVSDQEDQNWKTIESSFSDKVDLTLIAAPHIDKLFVDVQLDAFQPYIGKLKFGRVVLQTGESAVIPLVWLTEAGQINDTSNAAELERNPSALAETSSANRQSETEKPAAAKTYALLFGASGKMPVSDSHLVGTWEASSQNMSHSHGVPVITYNADHTCTDKGFSTEGPSVAHGKWHRRGRKLVTRYGGRIKREVIVRVGADRFTTRASDGTIWTYTRVKPER